MRLTLMRNLIQARSLKLRGGLGLSLISSSSGAATYDIRGGQTYFGLLNVAQSFGRLGIFAEVIYEELRQDTSQFEQNMKSSFGRLGITWDI